MRLMAGSVFYDDHQLHFCHMRPSRVRECNLAKELKLNKCWLFGGFCLREISRRDVMTEINRYPLFIADSHQPTAAAAAASSNQAHWL